MAGGLSPNLISEWDETFFLLTQNADLLKEFSLSVNDILNSERVKENSYVIVSAVLSAKECYRRVKMLLTKSQKYYFDEHFKILLEEALEERRALDAGESERVSEDFYYDLSDLMDAVLNEMQKKRLLWKTFGEYNLEKLMRKNVVKK